MMISGRLKIFCTVVIVLLAKCRITESTSIPQYLSSMSKSLKHIEGMMVNESSVVSRFINATKVAPEILLNKLQRRAMNPSRRSFDNSNNNIETEPQPLSPVVIDIELPSRRSLNKDEKKSVVKKTLIDDTRSIESEENDDLNINTNINKNVNENSNVDQTTNINDEDTNNNTNGENRIKISGRRSVHENISNNLNINENTADHEKSFTVSDHRNSGELDDSMGYEI